MMIKTYSELITIPTFEERLKYLSIGGKVGYETFGAYRYINQRLYRDPQWKSTRREAILRDSDGDMVLDLAHPDRPFDGAVYVHHINPITIDDIIERRTCVFDLDNIVCCSFQTHQDIHYATDLTIRKPIAFSRTQNDTIPWR